MVIVTILFVALPYFVKIKSEFSAAMKLNLPGACANIHGHTYKVSVEISVNKLNQYGIAVDYYDLEQKLNSIIKNIDHCYLNEHEWFVNTAPSSENIAQIIYYKFKELTQQTVTKVTISEMSQCEISYAE